MKTIIEEGIIKVTSDIEGGNMTISISIGSVTIKTLNVARIESKKEAIEREKEFLPVLLADTSATINIALGDLNKINQKINLHEL